MIKARGLARTFSGRGKTVKAVRGVDIDVEPGETIAFLGPNGAGKTTTLRMLTTLLKPTAGTATIGGHDLLNDPLGVRKNIGYVAQGGGTVGERKVFEEIALQGRLYGLSKAKVRERAADITGHLDLANLDNRLINTLSGGQRRRLDIALGLVHSPPLIFLDEPTTGLDPQSRANLWDHIRRLRTEQGVTIFLTTHYLDEADQLAERIVVIDHGQIVAEGSPDKLKATVAGDNIICTVARGQASAAADVITRLPGTHSITVERNTAAQRDDPTETDTLRFQVPRGDSTVAVLVRAMDASGVALLGAEVNRPTLDDVFLLLTGRGLRDDDAAADPAGEEPVHAA